MLRTRSVAGGAMAPAMRTLTVRAWLCPPGTSARPCSRRSTRSLQRSSPKRSSRAASRISGCRAHRREGALALELLSDHLRAEVIAKYRELGIDRILFLVRPEA